MESEFLAIKSLLDSSKVEYELSEHEPVFTSEEAARIRGVDLKTGVKALVFKADEEFILVLVPGDSRADMKKLREAAGKKDMRLATREEVLEVTGCEIGSVHPFGNLMGLRTLMERKILHNDLVNFNVGLHTMSVRMMPHDLREIVSPVVVDIVKD